MLERIFKKTAEKIEYLKLINLSTADGFEILTHNLKAEQTASDKLAATVSSLASLSNVASNQLVGDNLVITNIETAKGQMLIVNTHYQAKPCVLCLLTGDKQNIGHARYYALKVAKHISEI
ncbi:roadblock/LC7 domain-containing protein [Marinicella gelatinilytica]|uniref:roadblock/LC7 domain-containing protein n=1 Tax=Marinicella gelatinilytica TaxID=2996017 RepID=UPI002260F99D|nr:hypothetical protein [Marinicella gelatinilytica]MCX7544841.1 hypothetical protein [Marinicella gelatinilytica]